MRIRWVDGGGRLPHDLRSRVERRVRLVVGRRVSAIDVISIALTEPSSTTFASGPPGSLHSCRIRARLVGGESLMVEEQARGRDAAVEAATWRLARRLARVDARPEPGRVEARRGAGAD
jgi:hypothetical protein